MRKLIKTLVLLCTPIAAIPLAMTLTSCTNAFGGTVRVYTDPEGINVNSRYGQLSTETPGLKSLIYGTKKFCSGNYSLVFGSNAFDGTMRFMFNETAAEKRYLLEKAEMDNSPLVKAITEYQTDYPVDFKDKNIGITSYIDIYDDKSDDVIDIYSPFDKWSKTDKGFDEDKNKDGDWRREDKSAQEFRMFFDTMKILFGDKFKDDDIKTGVWAMYWKDGIPQKVDVGPTRDSYLKSLLEVYKEKK